MDKMNDFFTQFKNEMEKALQEKDIEINALKATNESLKNNCEAKDVVIDSQKRQIRKIQDDMKNTMARARGLQLLKEIKDPEGEKLRKEVKKIEDMAVEEENKQLRTELSSLRGFVGNLQGVLQRLMVTDMDGASGSTFEDDFSKRSARPSISSQGSVNSSAS
ncbi:Oidioi.mRNA.OKI2018_I69.chr1.g2046.t1.cds [Oikopleura dioica]|uniref:Oidioi.mRNA.OKI2018_I69.chr1.g2046.t1.cds n=1 Tax=Oikopleura dioica TaxID=34765 RepID=A0ABN7SQE4_OIKDI|nr:Oidioi.mRNA.OKI2018_I69.chr1.g2046.t1.cds [Oikopleura dioica]